MRATSSAGRASYENTVSWSGELGYGVRAPEKGQEFEDPEPEPPADHGHDDHGHDDHGGHH